MFNKKELKARKRKRLLELGSGPEPKWEAYAFLKGPQAELKARLNAWVKGIDPGDPVHWRGL